MGQRNKIISLILVAVIILSVLFATIYKVYKDHLTKEYEVLEKKISESAKKCFLDKKCTGTSTTLSNLKTNGYINEELVNPKTKEVLSDSLVITKSNDTYVVNID